MVSTIFIRHATVSLLQRCGLGAAGVSASQIDAPLSHHFHIDCDSHTAEQTMQQGRRIDPSGAGSGLL